MRTIAHMGLDLPIVRFLLHARRRGVSFARLATLGRQSLLAGRAELEPWLAAEPGGAVAAESVARAAGGFADRFWEYLGARGVTSFDASNFEGATVAQDFNQPVPPTFHARFDAVVDAGSLEHIFNVPVALANLMQLVAPGGHLLIGTTTNHFSGHGFYQFSPELFYRALAPENGFRVVRMLATEVFPDAFWYEVPDPAEVSGRVTINSHCETYLCVIARREEVRPLFTDAPQQSDYAALWQLGRGENDPIAPAIPPRPHVEDSFSARLRRHAWQRLLRFTRFRGRDRERMLCSPLFRRVEIP